MPKAQKKTAPWCDCKVAFAIDDADDDVCDAMADETHLPKGWSLNEIDGAGARWVAVFRVEGIPSVEDGQLVARRLKNLGAIQRVPRRQKAAS